MRLDALLADQETVLTPAAENDIPEIRGLACDSRRVQPGDLFFAVVGLRDDGHRHIDAALRAGAIGVVSERPAPEAGELLWIQTPHIRRAMAAAADSFFGGVSQRMPLAGITGTNGKTTTAYLVHSILSGRGPALMIGTIESRFGERSRTSTLTTPESIDLQRTLSEAWSAGCRSGVLEVSSHALDLDRVYRCRFRVGIFTNLSRDHLDYHRTFEHYLRAKQRLFDPGYNPGIECAVLNGDDPQASSIPVSGLDVIRFGLDPQNDVHPLAWESSVRGTRMTLAHPQGPIELQSPLAGEYNLRNVMAASAACLALGYSQEEVRSGVARLKCVPGRFERVPADHPASIFIDFAHTPDALRNVLALARRLSEGRVLCLFGCGGDKDQGKRPEMGRIATQMSDWTIITSDNPRSEPPERIVEEIALGAAPDASWESIVDRRQAIRRALDIARAKDIVVLAGKGHELYQEIGGRRFDFDERVEVRKALGRVSP